jgi:hypothetical protein
MSEVTMGLESLWNEEGEYLTKRSEKFRTRSTGCSCCSVQLDTEAEVRKEAIDSLSNVLLAQKYFNWDLDKLIREAKKDEKFKKFKGGKRASSPV